MAGSACTIWLENASVSVSALLFFALLCFLLSSVELGDSAKCNSSLCVGDDLIGLEDGDDLVWLEDGDNPGDITFFSGDRRVTSYLFWILKRRQISKNTSINNSSRSFLKWSLFK